MRELRSLLFAAAVLGGAGGVWAQQPAAAAPAQPPCSASPQPAPCSATPGAAQKPASTDRFPFPGEQSPAAAPEGAAGKSAASPSAPAAVTPNAPAGKAFPFPGDDDAGSSSSSSSSDAATPDTPDAGGDKPAAAGGRRLLKRVNPIGEKLQSPQEREAEDLNVAKFYSQSGDSQGAYLRSQDAVKIAPDDPDAHCSLAEMALKLNKRDEAIAEFNACLKLDPVEKEAKNARKQLAKLR